MYKYIIGLLFLSFIIIAVLTGALKRANREKERTVINQRILLEDSIMKYKARNRQLVASVEQLELSLTEVKQNRTKLIKEIHNMKIRPKDAIAIGETITETAVQIKAPIREEKSLETGKVALQKVFDWSDAWTNINGRIEEDSLTLQYNSLDTLVQVIHVEKHKFLFIRWGVKAIRQSVTLKNPNARIVGSEYIKIR